MLALGVGETITDGVQIYRLEDDLNLHCRSQLQCRLL